MKLRSNKQITFLVVLLAVFGLTLYLGPRLNRPPSVSVAQAAQSKTETAPAAANDARIRLDLIDRETQKDAGRQNLFQYRVAATPPPAPPRGSAPANDPFAAPPTPAVPPPRPFTPPTPPPPPPIPLKYQGFARSDPGGPFTAFLVDDVNHFNVKTGDVLMGRYRIATITDTAVEVEDLQLNRRQTLPLLK